jgi:hypothetical protein
MDILSGITAATEALKLTKELRSIDREIDKAELKLRLVEVIDRLMEAKEALQDARQDQRDLAELIDLLKKKIAQRASLKDEQGLLFEVDSSGKQLGEPYCNQCYVKDDKLFRLVSSPWNNGTRFHCTNCKFVHLPEYGRRR